MKCFTVHSYHWLVTANLQINYTQQTMSSTLGAGIRDNSICIKVPPFLTLKTSSIGQKQVCLF